MSCAIAKSLAWGLALLSPAGEPIPKAPPSLPAQSPADPVVSVKIRDAANVAFREHRGPYWTVGPEFTRLRQYLDDHDLTAPMFARFLNRPGSVRATDLRTEIGFFVPASHRPDLSFKSDALEPQMVAYTVLGDRIDSRAKDLARIRHWIHENGYEVDGPIMEIYHAHEKWQGARRWETEVQIPVAKRRPDQVVSKTPQPAPETAVDQTKNRGGERVDVKAPPVDSMKRIHDRAKPVNAMPTLMPEADTPSPGSAAAGSEADLLLEKRSSAAINGVEMFVTGDAKAFAGAVMPDKHDANSFDPVWRGHVGLRMIGILRGIEKLHPGDAPWASEFRQALADGFDPYAARLPANPKDQAIVTYGSPPQHVLQAEKEIMRALDGLLMRLGMGAAGPDDVRSELGSIVDQLTAPEFAAP